ncbi:MAG: hypothetical protein ACRDM9_02025 [Gaiellaceae bacterium]
MRNRRKHSIIGRLALPLAALAFAAPAQAVPHGYVPFEHGKGAVVGHQDGADGYQPQLQGNDRPAVEVRHSGPYSYVPELSVTSDSARRYAPPGYVPKVYVTSSDSTGNVAPIALRGQSPVATGGGELDGADMGIGAAVAFGGLLLLGGLGLAMRKGYRPTPA